jgi:penicillin amidase
MSAGDFDVIGATLPGIPAFALGRNRSIAWGATNMFADVQDLYRERLDPSGSKVEFRGVMEPLQLLTEVIAVKGSADVRVDVRISRHGPLVSDAINANNATSPAESDPMEPLAFRWTALEEEDTTIVAFLRLNEAHNWAEFSAALREFVVPSQNFVYADVDGHIGYYAPGRVPIRASGDGLMPVEGWSGQAEWNGWIPFEELPHAHDPASHFLVTANNRPVPVDYKYALGFEYHEPYRAQRITDLLLKKQALTPDDFRTIQSDTFSLHAQTLLPLLLQHVRPESGQERQAVDLLRKWNFDAVGNSPAAAIFSAWFLRLAPALVEDELGPDITGTYARHFTFITRFVTSTLRAGSGFCDRADTPTPEPCDAIVTAALREGLTMLREQLGDDGTHWQWAAVHRTVFPHQGLDTVTGLRWLLSRSIRNRGDWSTVNVGAVDVTRPFEQTEIPGYRQIIDLSPANDSRYLGSVGQAGHFLSPHYDDALTDWHELRHVPMRMDPAKIGQDAIGRLRLVPVTSAAARSSGL